LEQVVNAIVLGSCYCLFAIGLSLTWGTLNVLNLAHGAVFMFSAFTCYLLTQHLDLAIPLPWLILIAMAVGAAIPVTIAQKVTIDSPFTVTAKPINTTEYHIGSVYITNIEILIVVFTLVLTVGLAIWLQRSNSGRALRALSFDAETGGLMGISQGRMSALVLVLSGMTAGAAGVFLAVFLDSLTPESGSDLLLAAFAAVVIGGVGSVWGTLIGAFILAAGETLVSATTSGTWTQAVSFGLIIVVLLLRPSGLFSRVNVNRT
jgi:branched-chain amino acid transport system permease protein